MKIWSYCTPCIRTKQRGPVARAPPPEASLGGFAFLRRPGSVVGRSCDWVRHGHAASPVRFSRKTPSASVITGVRTASSDQSARTRQSPLTAHAPHSDVRYDGESSPFLLCRNVNPSLTKMLRGRDTAIELRRTSTKGRSKNALSRCQSLTEFEYYISCNLFLPHLS
jgi:hypothetical protein